MANWRKIKGFDNYEVNIDGVVINRETGTRLKTIIKKNGSRRVILSKKGVRKSISVDDLVAETFHTGHETKTKKRILVCETGQIFDSKADCSKTISVPSGALTLCLNGKKSSYKGLHFKEID